jgi:prepilin-type N-terminal cleavage/methylation domain-containing protein
LHLTLTHLPAGNSLKNNTGFTLIELLVVVVIVGILASFITLSIKLAKPSAIKTLKMKIQQHIVSVETYVQLYNQPIRLQVSQANKVNPVLFFRLFPAVNVFIFITSASNTISTITI